jgi:hypothetical protein
MNFWNIVLLAIGGLLLGFLFSNSDTSSYTECVSNQTSFPIVVVGGTLMDFLAGPNPGERLQLHTSNPGTIVQRWGGVRDDSKVL